MIESALFAAKSQLNLNTSQQQAWDQAVADTKAARQQGRTNAQALQQQLQSQLAGTGALDLGALAATGDQVQQQNQALRVKVRNEWIALYNTFSDEQKAVVKQIVAQRISRMQQMRERFQQRQGG
jgi:hypothetical protein